MGDNKMIDQVQDDNFENNGESGATNRKPSEECSKLPFFSDALQLLCHTTYHLMDAYPTLIHAYAIAVAIPMSPIKKQRKLYEVDERIPVPKTTQWRIRAKLASRLIPVEEDEKSLQEFPEHVGKTSDHMLPVVFCDQEDDPCLTETSGSDDSSTSLSCTADESDDELSMGSVSEEKTNQETSQLQSVAIASYSMRHRLTYRLTCSATEDLLKLINALCPETLSRLSLGEITGIGELIKVNIFHHCEIYGNTFPESKDIFECTTEECNGLRYKGRRNQQTHPARLARLSFLIGDVKSQLASILQQRFFSNFSSKMASISTVVKTKKFDSSSFWNSLPFIKPEENARRGRDKKRGTGVEKKEIEENEFMREETRH
eukprot:gene10114-18776_t